MSKIFFFVKLCINIILYCIYALIAIIFCNFFYWLYIDKVLGKAVPGSGDPIHYKLAILMLIFVLIITLIFRKFFYLSLKTKKWK